tara:strand:+ start:3069 stop:3293 length:225 start_codon:yes stop_codon:yes gene_type:complete
MTKDDGVTVRVAASDPEVASKEAEEEYSGPVDDDADTTIVPRSEPFTRSSISVDSPTPSVTILWDNSVCKPLGD